MDFDPKVYDKISNIQEEDAKQLVNWILTDFKDREKGIIVDVGSGSGKITTAVLAASIEHKKLLGIDSNPEMIEFSSKNYSIPKTEYCIGDISNDWDLLDEKIKNLEGNVDLIFSNCVLHWIPMKRRDIACSNIFRLLKPGGRFYYIIGLPKPISDSISPADKKLLKNYYEIFPIESQLSKWENFFENTGFANVKTDLVRVHWDCDSSEEYLGMLKIIFGWYANFLPSSNGQGVDVQELHDKVQDMVFRAYSGEFGAPLDEHFDPSKNQLIVEQFLGKGEKLKHVGNSMKNRNFT